MISAPVYREPDRCPGALTLHDAADGRLARIRLPGGFITAGALTGLADLAQRFGDGRLELTSRGNIQLRAVRAGEEAALAVALADLGLLPSLTHERVRNIVASSLAGLDRPSPSLLDLVRALDDALCATPELQELSGRFLFAVDDGRADTSVLRPDVSATWVEAHCWRLMPGGPLVASDAVVPGLIALARAFLSERRAQHSTAWHVRDLVDGAARVAARAAVTASATGTDARTDAPPADTPPGDTPPADTQPADATETQPSAPVRFVVVTVPLGRLSAEQARRLAAVTGAEPLRVTTERRVVLASLSDTVTREAAEQLLTEAGLACGTGSIWENLTACAGQPGCAKALADVQRDAARAARSRDGSGSGLAEHWSGCSRRCGHPRGRYLDVLAGPHGYTRAVREAEVPEAESVSST